MIIISVRLFADLLAFVSFDTFGLNSERPPAIIREGSTP